MKQFYFTLLLGFVLIFAAACGDETVDQAGNTANHEETEEESTEENGENGTEEEQGAENAVENDPEADGDQDQNQDQNVSAEEEEMLDLLEQMNEAEEDINSLSLKTTMIQHLYDDQEEMHIESSMYMDFVVDPTSFYLENIMEDSVSGESFTMEAYVKEDDFYFYDPEMDQWFLFPQEMTSEFLASQEEMEAYLESEYDVVTDYIEDFTLEEDDQHYILTLQTANEEYMELLEDMEMATMMEDPEFDQMMQSMDISNLEYELYIDKDTYFNTGAYVVMEGSLDIEGNEVNIEQEIEIEQLNINEFDEIGIPEEVMDGAEELDMSDFELE